MPRWRVLYPFRVVPAVATATGARVILDDTVPADVTVLNAARIRSAVVGIFEGRPAPREDDEEPPPPPVDEGPPPVEPPIMGPGEPTHPMEPVDPETGHPVQPMTTDEMPTQGRRRR